MNKTSSLFATLALAAVLLPIAFAQQGQTSQPSSDQSSQPTATQPNSGQTTPSTDQTAQPGTPAPAQTPDTTTMPSQTPETAGTPAATQNSFTGTVVKAGGKYVLKNDTMTYQLDDQTKAQQFEGKTVTVNGDLDKSTSIIHVTDIMGPNQK